jgi:hypothetical protein
VKIAQSLTVYIGVLFIFLIHPAIAESCPPGLPKTTIFYVNGLDNEPEDAEFSRSIFKNKFIDFISRTKPAAPGIEPNCLKFELAYNRTDGKILDIYETFRQRSREDSSFFWRLWSFLLPDIPDSPDSLAAIYLPVASQLDDNSIVNSDEIAKHVDKYKNEINAGNRVLILAHSQGNLHANKAYTILRDESDSSSSISIDSLGIVSVATPSTFVAGAEAGKEPYVTLSEDSVIRAVRRLRPLTLAPNASNGFLSIIKDPKGHFFVDAYLVGSDTDSELSIMLKVAGVIANLRPPRDVTIGRVQGFVNIVGDVPDGASLEGNTVFLSNSDTFEIIAQTLTNTEGFYQFSIQPGTYFLSAGGRSSGDCFLEGSIDGPINLLAGQVIDQDINLTPICPGV